MDTRTRRATHPHNTTLGQIVQAYLYHVENTLAPRTLESYRHSLGLFVAFCGEDTLVSDLTDLQVVRWMRARLNEGKSPNTVRGDYRRLRYGLLGWAVERAHVSRNWAALAKPPAEPDEPGRSVSERDLGRLLMVTKGSVTEYRDKFLLLLLWCSGMRIGEVTQLELRDVWGRGPKGDEEVLESIHVRAETTKTNAERWVPFDPQGNARAACMDYLAFERGLEPGRLFLSSRTGQGWAEQTGKHIVRELGKLAGVEVGAHDFRRAVVERMQRAGMSDTLIMQVTGHKSVTMVIRYARRAANENAIEVYRRLMA